MTWPRKGDELTVGGDAGALTLSQTYVSGFPRCEEWEMRFQGEKLLTTGVFVYPSPWSNHDRPAAARSGLIEVACRTLEDLPAVPAQELRCGSMGGVRGSAQ